MTKKLFSIAFLCVFFSGCATVKKDVVYTYEPSIERAMDLLVEMEEGKELLSYINENPLKMEYSNTAGLCNKYNLSSRTIYLARAFKDNDFMLALGVARGIYMFRLMQMCEFDDILAEMEEEAALFVSRLALKMHLVEGDYSGYYSKGLKNEFCIYITQNGDALRQNVRRRVLSRDKDCGYPLETLESQIMWLDKIKNSRNSNDLFQILNERNMRKVKKGNMTIAEAMKRDAEIRGMPTYDLYRFQRTFYELNLEIISTLRKTIEKETKADAEWRSKNQKLFEIALMEFASCKF